MPKIKEPYCTDLSNRCEWEWEYHGEWANIKSNEQEKAAAAQTATQAVAPITATPQ